MSAIHPGPGRPLGEHSARAPRGASSTTATWVVWLRSNAHAGKGPESAGLGSIDRAYSSGNCLTLLRGDDPLVSWYADEGFACILQGVLTERDELRRRLGFPASQQASDAQLALAAWRAWGTDTANELEGAYAIVIWDERRGVLHGIRDPVGVVPLFYARAGAGWIISPDMETLLCHPDVSREINRVVLAEHLINQLSNREETFFSHVRRLPGGCRLQLQGTDATVTRYWEPLPKGEPVSWIGREELAGFPELMRRTVAAYLPYGPLGISLSAGIDSVSVAAFATEVAREQQWPTPHALSIHFPHPTTDESTDQTAVARALGLDYRLLPFAECLQGRSMLEQATELAPRYSSPLTNTWEPIYTYLGNVAHDDGLKIVLTGNGGDEWLAVTPLLAADLIRTGNIAALWRLYLSQVRSYHLSRFYLAYNALWRFGLQSVLRDVAYRHVPGWVSRRRRPLVLPAWVAPDPELHAQLLDRLQPPPPQAPVDPAYVREMRTGIDHPLISLELEELYCRGRACGVSYLHPYWTRPIMSLLLRTPPDLLLEGGLSKGCVRRLIGEQFPELEIHRKKKVRAASFFENVVVGEWREIWKPWAQQSALAAAGVVDASRLEREMERMESNRSGYITLWLLSEAWLRGQVRDGLSTIGAPRGPAPILGNSPRGHATLPSFTASTEPPSPA